MSTVVPRHFRDDTGRPTGSHRSRRDGHHDDPAAHRARLDGNSVHSGNRDTRRC